MDSAPRNAAPRPGLAVALAFVGFSLLAGAYLALAAGFFGGASAATLLGTALGVAGIACHVAALALSLRAWRATGRTPRVALFYAALGVAALAAWGLGRQREAAFYRDNPDVFLLDTAGDGVDVRDTRGVWHVRLDACPGTPTEGFETRQHGDVAEVVGASGRPYMRLVVAERRVVCLAG